MELIHFLHKLSCYTFSHPFFSHIQKQNIAAIIDAADSAEFSSFPRTKEDDLFILYTRHNMLISDQFPESGNSFRILKWSYIRSIYFPDQVKCRQYLIRIQWSYKHIISSLNRVSARTTA